MDYKILYLPIAEQDLQEIAEYLSNFYPSTLKKFIDNFDDNIRLLQTNPCLGMPYHQYRKLVLTGTDYLVFYKVDETESAVKIYRVLHGARDSEIRKFKKGQAKGKG